MPQRGDVPINNFVRGLITEASPLTFPEGASLDEINFALKRDGSRERRLGLDLEDGYGLHDTGLTAEILKSARVQHYRWSVPNGNVDRDIGVVQVGNRIFFINLYAKSPSNAILNGGNAVVATGLPNESLMTFTTVNNYLVGISNQLSQPYLFSYNVDTDVVTVETSAITVRDLWGVTDHLEADERPAVLTDAHEYNLRNQGWSDSILVKGEAEIQRIGFPEGVSGAGGNITFGGIHVAVTSTDNPWDVAGKVAATLDGAIPSNATFPIRATNSGTNSVTLTYSDRDGDVALIPFVDTDSQLAAAPIITDVWQGVDNSGVTAIDSVFNRYGVYPSNGDSWQIGRVEDLTSPDANRFDPEVARANLLDTGFAARGKFIIPLYNRGTSRFAQTGLTLPTDQEMGRFTAIASYAGRVFYGGILSRVNGGDDHSPNLSGTVLFSQVFQNKFNLVRCYQEADPTSPNINDLVDTDGGVIVIPECSYIHALMPIKEALFVFAANGVWAIMGDEGGFRATSFQVKKISNIGVYSPKSIVEAEGAIYFWASTGIFVLKPNEQGNFDTINLTMPSIQKLYNNLTDSAKKNARGYYDLANNRARWLYHSPATKVFGQAVDVVGQAPLPMSEAGEILLIDDAASQPRSALFSDNHAFVMYRIGFTPINCRLATINLDLTVTQGAAVAVNATGSAEGYDCIRIRENKVLVVSKVSTGELQARVATLSGTTISLGTPLNLGSTHSVSLSPNMPKLAEVSEGKFILATRNLDNGRFGLQVIEVSGSDVITIGAINILSPFPTNVSFPSVAMQTPTTGVISHATGVQRFTLAGTAVTYLGVSAGFPNADQFPNPPTTSRGIGQRVIRRISDTAVQLFGNGTLLVSGANRYAPMIMRINNEDPDLLISTTALSDEATWLSTTVNNTFDGDLDVTNGIVAVTATREVSPANLYAVRYSDGETPARLERLTLDSLTGTQRFESCTISHIVADLYLCVYDVAVGVTGVRAVAFRMVN
jgi:hypothetical protein